MHVSGALRGFVHLLLPRQPDLCTLRDGCGPPPTALVAIFPHLAHLPRDLHFWPDVPGSVSLVSYPTCTLPGSEEPLGAAFRRMTPVTMSIGLRLTVHKYHGATIIVRTAIDPGAREFTVGLTRVTLTCFTALDNITYFGA